MSKLKALKTLLSQPIRVIKDGIVAQSERNHQRELIKKYGIDSLPTIDLMALCTPIKPEENLRFYSFLDGTSHISDLLLLKQLARKYDDCSFLEIGSWRGESIANVSDVAAKCVSVTLPDVEMEQVEMGGKYIGLHGIFSKDIENIETIRQNSQTFDFNSLNTKFDLIFVDGDHTYNGVKTDTEKVFNLRKNENSIIVWHDYGFSFETVRHSVLKGILDGIPRDKHRNLYHVSNTMCAVYVENIHPSTYQTLFPTLPNKNFVISISIEPFNGLV